MLNSASHPLARQADGLNALAIAKEQASRQHGVVLAAILSGVLPAEQQAVLRTADARFDAAADEFGQAVATPQLFNTRVVIDRKRLLDAVLDRAVRAAPLATVPGDWNSAAAGTVEAIRQGEINQLNELRTAAAARSDQAWDQALATGATVAALLVLAVVMLLVVVRSLLQPLRTLCTAAFDVADRQLPEAVEQLQSTNGRTSHTTVDPVPVHSREEIGHVARAVDTVHTQAVRLATEQAVARSSLNDTFRTLSERNQNLVARQRQLIDELRSSHHDPELSSSLLHLDHLAARMRRHGDNLLVLAGGTLPQGGHARVAVLDVLRSAVSAVEQHAQVTMRQPPAAMVAGLAVNDLVHLIAELLDNAIKAGAPQGTTVTLSGALTADGGLLVEIIDSGPGLPPAELQAINARLASPPAADAPVPQQRGLFVVSRLAAQHGITVRLRQRLGQIGITAAVSVRSALVWTDAGSVDPRPSSDGVPETPATTEWNGADERLPLQVSVIDEAVAGDLFSPASIGIVASQRPRTAEQEWHEFFGDDRSQPDREPLADEAGAGSVASGPAIVTAADSPVSPLPLGSAAAAGQPPEVREEIFEMVSAWFREQQSASASGYQSDNTTELPVLPNGVPISTNTSSTNAHGWRSPLDEEWQAAQALRIPVDHGVTQAGLPKRQPLAQLVSGVDGTGRGDPAPVTAGLIRTPDEVRGRLSRYQRGLRVGRHARIGPDEQPTVTDTLPGRLEEDQQ